MLWNLHLGDSKNLTGQGREQFHLHFEISPVWRGWGIDHMISRGLLQPKLFCHSIQEIKKWGGTVLDVEIINTQKLNISAVNHFPL